MVPRLRVGLLYTFHFFTDGILSNFNLCRSYAYCCSLSEFLSVSVLLYIKGTDFLESSTTSLLASSSTWIPGLCRKEFHKDIIFRDDFSDVSNSLLMRVKQYSVDVTIGQ